MRSGKISNCLATGALLLGALVGCSGAPTAIEGKGGARASGGQSNSGGALGSGGETSGPSGGSGGSGGASEQGGSAGGQGGSSSSGGTIGSGGSASSGGNRDAGRDARPEGGNGSGGDPGAGGTTQTNGGTGGRSTGTPGSGGRSGTGGSPGTGGRPGTGGAPGTGGSTSDGFDWGTTTYNANGGSGVAYQGHFTGQTCVNPTCHRHNISYGGTIYQSNGSSTAGNIQIGIRSGNNLVTTYSGSQGNFYGNLSGASWSTAQIAIRNASGTAVMPVNANASGECNSCHGSSNRIVVP